MAGDEHDPGRSGGERCNGSDYGQEESRSSTWNADQLILRGHFLTRLIWWMPNLTCLFKGGVTEGERGEKTENEKKRTEKGAVDTYRLFFRLLSTLFLLFPFLPDPPPIPLPKI